jgi:uncharacterized membrane protein YraQ (UPF0718 family)
MDWALTTLRHAGLMLWSTFWALVLGFGISAALQVFVTKDQMTRAFGRANLQSMLMAAGLGAASSSCSYAAVAAARSAFSKGAALAVALAFMFASTNLVVELGTVLWVLMGWQFVVAEVVGAIVLIAVMWLLMTIWFPDPLEAEAHQIAARNQESACHDHAHGDHGDERITEPWSRIAAAFWMDWTMLWKEIFGGFLIAGFLSAAVPADWWKNLFIQGGNESLRLLENAAVGPVIAMASFVCSVGNIPLATLLWANGISFGGVIAFIFGDLIVIPIILIYWKYYGGRAAFRITVILYLSMVVAGVLVDLIFAAAGLVPAGPRAAAPMEHATIQFNYTAWLNIAAAAVAGWLFLIRSRSQHNQPHCH